jgi:hypothetical protein
MRAYQSLISQNSMRMALPIGSGDREKIGRKAKNDLRFNMVSNPSLMDSENIVTYNIAQFSSV